MAEEQLTPLQKSAFLVQKPIRYRKKDHKLFGQIVTPQTKGAADGLDFSHIPDVELQMLVKLRILTAKGAK